MMTHLFPPGKIDKFIIIYMNKKYNRRKHPLSQEGSITKNEKSHSLTDTEFRHDSIYIGFDRKKSSSDKKSFDTTFNIWY